MLVGTPSFLCLVVTLAYALPWLATAAGLALDNAKAAAWGLWQDSTAHAIDFAKLHGHKEAVVAQLRQGVETLMAQPGIELVRGVARLKDAHTVTCNGTDYTADNIIIATGSHPVMPRVEGIDNSHVVSSTGLLALAEQPRRLVIIGAGVIGMEMASAFNAFGTEVTVVEFLKECLPMADADLAKRLRKSLEKRGVKFYLSAAAEAQGRKVIDTIVGRKSRLDTTLVPWAVFTTPELAGTGLTEDAAKASLPDGEHPQVVKTYYRSNGKAVTMDATDGLVKLIASPDSRLLACHALGAHAADLVQEVSALISTGATLDDLQSVIHIHPTLQELL